jgi:hypothetical protein
MVRIFTSGVRICFTHAVKNKFKYYIHYLGAEVCFGLLHGRLFELPLGLHASVMFDLCGVGVGVGVGVGGCVGGWVGVRIIRT